MITSMPYVALQTTYYGPTENKNTYWKVFNVNAENEDPWQAALVSLSDTSITVWETLV
jgi:hypothetical protein